MGPRLGRHHCAEATTGARRRTTARTDDRRALPGWCAPSGRTTSSCRATEVSEGGPAIALAHPVRGPGREPKSTLERPSSVPRIVILLIAVLCIAACDSTLTQGRDRDLPRSGPGRRPHTHSSRLLPRQRVVAPTNRVGSCRLGGSQCRPSFDRCRPLSDQPALPRRRCCRRVHSGVGDGHRARFPSLGRHRHDRRVPRCRTPTALTATQAARHRDHAAAGRQRTRQPLPSRPHRTRASGPPEHPRSP